MFHCLSDSEVSGGTFSFAKTDDDVKDRLTLAIDFGNDVMDMEQDKNDWFVIVVIGFVVFVDVTMGRCTAVSNNALLCLSTVRTDSCVMRLVMFANDVKVLMIRILQLQRIWLSRSRQSRN